MTYTGSRLVFMALVAIGGLAALGGAWSVVSYLGPQGIEFALLAGGPAIVSGLLLAGLGCLGLILADGVQAAQAIQRAASVQLDIALMPLEPKTVAIIGSRSIQKVGDRYVIRHRGGTYDTEGAARFAIERGQD